jgi:hypothetical protein
MNLLLARFVSEIKQAQQPLGLCHAYGYDHNGNRIDGARLEYNPKDDMLTRAWGAKPGGRMKLEKIGRVREYK